MIGYIYNIINTMTNQRYVGQTIDIKRRKQEHLSNLKNNKHPNIKLQNSWNKYGENNFNFTYQSYEINSKDELNQLEILAIKYYDSYNNGFNLTLGGDGGNTRGKLTYEDYCLIYLGCQWQGLTIMIGEYFNVDSSTVSSILRGQSYLHFKIQADSESNQVKDYYISKFRKIFNIPSNQEFDISRTPIHITQEMYFYCFCIASCYGRGIEQALARYFNKHKSFLSNGLKSSENGIVFKAHQDFMKLNDEEVKNFGFQKFNEWNIQSFSKIKIKQMFHNKWRK